MAGRVTVGRPIRKTIPGADGQPAAESRGEAVIETADDDTPGGTDVRYLDLEGLPMAVEGAAVVRYERDAYGHAVQTAYLDGAGAEAPSTEGKVVVRTRYDDAGRPVEELFVDGTGAPRASKDGCAGHRSQDDALGRMVEESCLDAKGQVGMSNAGWAIRRTLHDARGNAVRPVMDRMGRYEPTSTAWPGAAIGATSATWSGRRRSSMRPTSPRTTVGASRHPVRVRRERQDGGQD